MWGYWEIRLVSHNWLIVLLSDCPKGTALSRFYDGTSGLPDGHLSTPRYFAVQLVYKCFGTPVKQGT